MDTAEVEVKFFCLGDAATMVVKLCPDSFCRNRYCHHQPPPLQCVGNFKLLSFILEMKTLGELSIYYETKIFD